MAGPFFSNHYNSVNLATGVGHDSRATGVFYAPTLYGESNLKVKRARITVPSGADIGTTGDFVWVMDLRSSDAPYEVYVTADSAWGAATLLDLGLYESSTTETIGAVIDANLYGQDDYAAGVARLDNFDVGALTDTHRGRALWEQADAGGGSYSSDPGETWSLLFTAAGAIAVTSGIATLDVEVWYASTS